MWLTDLADVLRGAGLTVVERDRWKTRGHGAMADVQSIVLHHTAGPAAGEAPSLPTVENGRPDLAGPLAHLLLGRSGRWYVVAAGLCWHAGATFEPWQSNGHAIGIEGEATGVDPWPPTQYASYVNGVRALANHYRVPYSRVLGHREVAKPRGRKVDPNFACDVFRAQLGDVGTGTRHPTIRRGDTGPAVEELQRLLAVVGPGDPGYGTFGPRTDKAVRAFQAAHGLVVDGIVGPATWAKLNNI